MNELNTVVESAQSAFAQALTPADLENAKALFLGKSGRITELMKGMASLPVEQKKTQGAAINLAKQAIESALNARRQALADAQLQAQLAAEAVGVSLDKIEMITMDTLNMGNAGSASASRLTFMSGNAVKGAADRAKERWDSEERPSIVEYTYLAPETTPFDKETGKCMPNFAYAYVAQVAEVDVDTETGVVKILKIISADDVGKALNPTQVEGQIEGAVVQAQGYVLMENFITRDGFILTDQLSTYLLPTIRDIPDFVKSIILEIPDDRGPWGAKGLGELPYLPMAPAILSAVHAATGVWFDEFPLTPERVLRGLGKI